MRYYFWDKKKEQYIRILSDCNQITFISLVNGYMALRLTDTDFINVLGERLRAIIEDQATSQSDLSMASFLLEKGYSLVGGGNPGLRKPLYETAVALKQVVRRRKNEMEVNSLIQINSILVELKAYESEEEILDNLSMILRQKDSINAKGLIVMVNFFTNFPTGLPILGGIRSSFFDEFESVVIKMMQKKDKELLVSNMEFLIAYTRALTLTSLYKRYPRMESVTRFVLNYAVVNHGTNLERVIRIMPVLLEMRLFDQPRFEGIFQNVSLSKIDVSLLENEQSQSGSKSDVIYSFLCRRVNGVLEKNLHDSLEKSKQNENVGFTIEDCLESEGVGYENEKFVHYMPVDIYIPDINNENRRSPRDVLLPKNLIVEIQGASHYSTGSNSFDCKTETKLRHLFHLSENVTIISSRECYTISQIEEAGRFEALLEILRGNMLGEN